MFLFNKCSCLLKYIYPRCPVNSKFSQRFMSKSGDDKSSGTGNKETTSKEGKDAKSSEPAKKDTTPKENNVIKDTKPKDETAIKGGTKCKPTINPVKPIDKSKKRLKTCDELLLGKPKKKKAKLALTAIQGGDLGCQAVTAKKPPITGHSKLWQKISLFGVLPLIAILTLLVFSSRAEEERLEFKNYPHMYKRSKPFWFRDGNRTAFHNSYFNALPPGGYEDEIDESTIGQDPESEKDKKARLKEFEKVVKNWRKHSSKRDNQLKKEAAAAEKESRKQEAQ
ncbi:uncharacterized protein LOC128257907 [Drosophila gunungcola]|uniref:uncharacterized protein LOC128257907 n=1 Tax=Drosophila gunungcola TaxID=103775 RepID=UPI0022E58714|nr:uncharacterized protein LOC128257907 [Drosophila gunungcola]XP_052845118.1 uncharacterized protein LOC128257907 [Drosophila gunungcola]